jgi:hypothetical protein
MTIPAENRAGQPETAPGATVKSYGRRAVAHGAGCQQQGGREFT